MEYKCSICGGEEFISQLNQYDVYAKEDNKLRYVKSELINVPLILYCRECSTPLQYDIKNSLL